MTSRLNGIVSARSGIALAAFVAALSTAHDYRGTVANAGVNGAILPAISGASTGKTDGRSQPLDVTVSSISPSIAHHYY